MPRQRACSGKEQTTGALHVTFLYFYHNMTADKPKAQRQCNSIFFHGSLQINGFVHMLSTWECHMDKMPILVQNTLPENIVQVH